MDTNISSRKSCSFCGIPGGEGLKFGGGLGAMICENCVNHYHEIFQSTSKTAKAHEPPWDSMTDAEILSNLPLIQQTQAQAFDFLLEWVELARSRKISWAEIGKVFGVSRQAAWERFAQRVEARGRPDSTQADTA
jgi:ADP-heptose:LPS heptosyltransferase